MQVKCLASFTSRNKWRRSINCTPRSMNLNRGSGSMRTSNSILSCHKADLFVDGRLRGKILFAVYPKNVVSTIMLLADFVTFDSATGNDLIRQMMEWIQTEYVGATNIEVKGSDTFSRKLNERLRALCRANKRIKPAGRAHVPANQGEKRHARVP